MLSESNSLIAVAMVLIARNHQLKSCISPSDPEFRTSKLRAQGV